VSVKTLTSEKQVWGRGGFERLVKLMKVIAEIAVERQEISGDKIEEGGDPEDGLFKNGMVTVSIIDRMVSLSIDFGMGEWSYVPLNQEQAFTLGRALLEAGASPG
jgi:hypothetical protein